MSEEESFKKREEYLFLLDLYEPLLSPSQAKVLDLVYRYDLSLREIALEQGITHEAVADALRKGNAKLKSFEDKLALAKAKTKRDEAINKALSIGDEAKRLEALETLAKEIIHGI